MMLIGDLLDRASIVPRASASTKRKALSVVAESAARAYDADAGEILAALEEREQIGSTGVGHGVAVPHARLPGLAAVRGVFLRLEQPVAFGSIDDQPVDLIFALLAPKDAGAEHLRALARVSRLLRRPDLREQLRQARDADAIHALLAQETGMAAA